MVKLDEFTTQCDVLQVRLNGILQDQEFNDRVLSSSRVDGELEDGQLSSFLELRETFEQLEGTLFS
jgi:hypothetical protein